MNSILSLLRKDCLGFCKNRVAVLLTFVVPITLMWVFGAVFGVNRSNPGPSGIPLVVINDSASPAVEKIIARLTAETAFRVRRSWTDEAKTPHAFTEAQARTAITGGGGDYRFALVFPSDALSDRRFGLRLKLLFDPRNEIETQTVLGLLERNIFTAAPEFAFASLRNQAVGAIGEERTARFYDQLADTVSGSFGADRTAVRESMNPGADPLAALQPAGAGGAGGSANVLSRLVQFEKEQLVGKKVGNPYATRLVGGWAIMFLMFSVTAASTALLVERDAGLFLRLLSMPVTRAHILWSKYLFNFALGLVQLATCFLAGAWLFKIDVTANLPVLIAAGVCTSAACTAIGMLLAAVSNTPETARGLSTLVILMMSALGGAWWPVSGLGGVLGFFTKCTLTYWAQEAFAQALWVRAPLAQAWPALAVLLAMAAVLNAASLALFRRGAMFR